MYTQSSVDLKADFYCRYGETRGKLVFERTAMPCVALDSGGDFLAFGLKCGIRAYGRGYGDVLRIIDSDSDICKVSRAPKGMGAQILYKADMAEVNGSDGMVAYTVNKLLAAMNIDERVSGSEGIYAVCDVYAPKGWCAVKRGGEIKSVPFPIGGYNVILIRTVKKRFNCGEDARAGFCESEFRRINEAAEVLSLCREDLFFEILNESQASAERLLCPAEEQVLAKNAAMSAPGVAAAKICNIGIAAFCEKDKTDAAVHMIRTEGLRTLGYPLNIAVVK